MKLRCTKNVTIYWGTLYMGVGDKPANAWM